MSDWLPEIDLRIETMEVWATQRRLRFSWTYEAQQDLEAFQDLSVGIAGDILSELFGSSGPIDCDWRVEGF